MQDKGLLASDVDTRIQDNISVVENFLFLNKLTNSSRRIIPLTSSQTPFISFSERELAMFFWKQGSLKGELQAMAYQDSTLVTSTNDLDSWIGGKEPGFLIKRFLCDVDPSGLSSRGRKKAGYRAAVKLWSLDEIRIHLDVVKSPSLDPVSYNRKGYVLRGSIRTDGFRILLLAFKLRELQDVRFRRLPENRLPPRLTSTVGGTDYYLQEIRHVLTSAEDVERLFPGTPVERIKILTLDAGQVCVVGAFAHLPEELQRARDDMIAAKGDSAMEGILSTTQEAVKGASAAERTPAQQAVSVASGSNNPVLTPRPVFFNLAAKSKAVYQPGFRFRRWTEMEKKLVPEGESNSISDIETSLPPLRGPDASVIGYVDKLRQVEKGLQAFYDSPDLRYKRHQYDMQRAKHTEFQLLAERLLNIVGGSSGRLKDPQDAVLIGIGLGDFQGRSGLTSLHSTFLDYFIKLVRSNLWIVCTHGH